MQLYHGDCLEVMKQIPDKSINLVLTDPPYNIKKAEWDKWKTKEGYVQWCGEWILECQRVLKENGSFYFFHNDMTQIATLMEWIRQNTKFVFKSFLVVDKLDNNYIKDLYGSQEHFRNYLNLAEYCLFYTFQDETGLSTVMLDTNNFPTLRKYFKEYQEALGMNIKQINSALGHRKAEHCFYWKTTQWDLPTKETYNELEKLPLKYGFIRRGYESLRQEYESLRQEYESLRYTFNTANVKNNTRANSNIWEYDFSKKAGHITPKPTDLLENILKHSSNEGDLVLDCFMGSGSTGVACLNTNREFIGIEKDDKYFEIAKKRIEEHKGELFNVS